MGASKLAMGASKLGSALGSTVPVLVRADATEDGGATNYEWHGRLAMSQPLHILASEWAEKHGVPAAAVGFDDSGGTELALDATPTSLGWRGGVEVELKAFPREERFMEAAEPATPSRGAVPARGAAKKAAQPPATSVQANPPSQEATGRGRGRGASAKSVAAAAAKGKGAAAAIAPSTPAKRSGEANPATPGASSSKRKAAAPPAPATPAAPSSGSLPGEADAISYVQENPKREGTSAHERFEKYKVARTIAEAMALGASRGDVQHDFKKGFLMRKP